MTENENKGGRPVKDTVIYVTVDTKNISEGDVDQHVEFSDDRNDPEQEPGKPQDYVSTINPGKKVYWRGVAKDPKSGDTIEITEVETKNTDGEWKLLVSVGPEQGNSKAREGRIKGKFIKGQESYSVKFRINEGSGNEYMVDPKLQME